MSERAHDEPRPDGARVTPEDRNRAVNEGEQGILTGRSREREAEDARYVPVIVKRTDESVRHADDILTAAIHEGRVQLERPALALALSAMAAGGVLAFTALAAGVAQSELARFGAPALTRFGTALAYPLGFVVCLMSRFELFTEHTATAVYPLLDGQARLVRVLRLWGLVGAGNIAGAFAAAALLVATDGVIGAREGYFELAHHMVRFDSPTLFASAVLAGWLMALGAWLVLATPPGVTQVVVIYLVILLIGLGQLHHSIAGAVEVFTATLMGAEILARDVVRFLVVALLGNLVGGSVFVALLNYGHIRKSEG